MSKLKSESGHNDKKDKRDKKDKKDRKDKPEKKEKTHKRKHRSKSSNLFKQIAWQFLLQFIVLVHLIKDKLLACFFQWYWGERKTCQPLPTDQQFLQKSAVDLSKMIRNKELTSQQVVEATINRIKQVNPLLNAIIDGPFMESLNEAKTIDDRIAKGDISDDEFQRKPFLGVPFTTKDSTSVNGALHTLGVWSRRENRATEDAECVRLTREAGGIIIATTSVPEVNRWQETRNYVIGHTNNPYDSRRTVGGSSGGEGALISSCASPFGLGTDIGGSIRMPAYYCGIFGHKPTVELVSTKGCTFRKGDEPTMVVAGPMARYSDDLSEIFKVLVGPEKSLELKLDESVDVTKLKYYFIRESGEIRCSPICSDLKKAMTKVVNHLSKLTATPAVEAKLTHIDQTFNLWRFWMRQEKADFAGVLGNGKSINWPLELIKKLSGTSKITMASLYSFFERFLPKGDDEVQNEMTRQMEEEFNDLLGDDGILIYPSTTHVAPFHYEPLVNIANFTYWCIFNVLKVPATQVPLGLNSNGLPVGIQIVATKNRDRHCLAVARELEKAFGGWVPPFPK